MFGFLLEYYKTQRLQLFEDRCYEHDKKMAELKAESAIRMSIVEEQVGIVSKEFEECYKNKSPTEAESSKFLEEIHQICMKSLERSI